jgi:inhibitor of cysteine peptidase
MTSPAAALALGVMTAAGATHVALAADRLVPVELAAATPSTAGLVLDETSSGAAQAAVGSRVEVRLKAQFGTGFSWALSRATETVVKPAGEAVLPAAAGQTPEGGFETQVFTFEAVAPGEAQLEFVYRRPWLPNDPANKHVSFFVTVAPK